MCVSGFTVLGCGNNNRTNRVTRGPSHQPMPKPDFPRALLADEPVTNPVTNNRDRDKLLLCRVKHHLASEQRTGPEDGTQQLRVFLTKHEKTHTYEYIVHKVYTYKTISVRGSVGATPQAAKTAWKPPTASAASEADVLHGPAPYAPLKSFLDPHARNTLTACWGRGHGGALERGRSNEGLSRSDKHHEEESKQLHIAMAVG